MANRKTRCKVHTHTNKNEGANCFICKASANRTFRKVECGTQTVLCCRPCINNNNLVTVGK